MPPFPESDRVVFAKNPLVEVVCQLRFPTILDISKEEPAAFQRAIRQFYPLYEVEKSLTLPAGMPDEIAKLLGSLGPVAPTLHKFSSAEGDLTITLAPEFLAVTSSEGRYRHWEDFGNEIARARLALEQTYQPAFYTRTGLRYRNVISRAKLELDAKPWAELFAPTHIGLLASADLVGDFEAMSTDVVVQVPEIPGGKCHLVHGLIRGEPDSYLIDADFYTQERMEPDDIAETLERFNRHAGNFFRWFISPYLAGLLGRADEA